MGLRSEAAAKAIRQPLKTARLLLSTRGWLRLAYALRPPAHGRFATRGPLEVRMYPTYESYLAHQRSKLALLDLSTYDVTFRASLRERLGDEWQGRSILCLAARIGTEVKAFLDAGAFAVGIDLNPGPDNCWVLPGDFHDLVFSASSVDAVYCNSLDHALDLPRILAEVHRVLKPAGTFTVDAQIGAADAKFDDWAATSWTEIDDLVSVAEAHGFVLHRREPIDSPWKGEEIVFGLRR